MKRKQRAFFITYEIIKQEVWNEKDHWDYRPEKNRKGQNPQKGNGFLERRAPVVELFILQTILLQIKRKFDQVIDIDGDPESVCENELRAVQAESLSPGGSQQNVSKDRHRSVSRKVK
jgi:hypothetical protein